MHYYYDISGTAFVELQCVDPSEMRGTVSYDRTTTCTIISSADVLIPALSCVGKKGKKRGGPKIFLSSPFSGRVCPRVWQLFFSFSVILPYFPHPFFFFLTNSQRSKLLLPFLSPDIFFSLSLFSFSLFSSRLAEQQVTYILHALFLSTVRILLLGILYFS